MAETNSDGHIALFYFPVYGWFTEGFDTLDLIRGLGLVESLPTSADVAFCQSIDREGGDVRASKPGWIELWSKRHEKQHRKGPYPINYPTKHFQARGVGPMRILEDHQHRTLVRQGLHLGNERFQSSLSALLGGEFE